jgi:glycosyltransferase involved in cell wall biosynthesis
MRVAIVSDPLVQRGGAERVVEAMAQAFPDAPIFALLYSPLTGPASLRERVIVSPLGRVPGAARRHRLFLPLYPAAIESFDTRGYDVVLSSHHTVAKGVVRRGDAVHVCYCHTPMRALWERSQEELATLPAPLRPLGAALFRRLRVWDVATVPRVDRFVANSATTRNRISKHYGRESTIIYPPIDVDRFTPGAAPPGEHYLVAARPVAYKRLDLAIEATRLAGRRLVVAGSPPPRDPPPHVTFLGHVSDDALVEAMRSARALLFPQEEDFGMTPLEMMACGRPVIAFGRGGATESVVDGETGVLIDEQTAEAFADGIRRFEGTAIDPRACRAQAERFGATRFRTELAACVADAYGSANSR